MLQQVFESGLRLIRILQGSLTVWMCQRVSCLVMCRHFSCYGGNEVAARNWWKGHRWRGGTRLIQHSVNRTRGVNKI